MLRAQSYTSPGIVIAQEDSAIWAFCLIYDRHVHAVTTVIKLQLCWGDGLFFCRGVYEQLKAALALPCETRAAVDSSSKSQYLFGGGARHILPSFFNLLKHLQAQVP